VITAIDSNVILDVLVGDRTHGPTSADALRRALGAGSLIACEVVWAELAAAFDSRGAVTTTLGRLGIEYSPVERDQALAAGEAWRRYRRGGGPRERLIGDFLVGAHAAGRAERLLTRDRGFYRRCFSELHVLDPALDR
jgi:predicted nucleic acid-binding protein